MRLTHSDITQFQALYKKHVGKTISRQEAREKGMKLLRLMQLIYKPITQAEYDRLHKPDSDDAIHP